MSDLLHYAKTGGKVVVDVFGGGGAVVGFADATGYYYASAGLNAVLQTQFQAAGWPTTTTIVGKGDVKGAIMFARDQYYAKAKSALGGAFTDLAKGYSSDWALGVLAGAGTGFIGLGAFLLRGTIKTGLMAWDLYEGGGKLKGAYDDINSFNYVPKIPDGPAKTAATVLVNHSYGQKNFPPRSRGQAASDAVGYILGTEVSAYRSRDFGYKSHDGAINRVAAWISPPG
jgi:hypothetical protein